MEIDDNQAEGPNRMFFMHLKPVGLTRLNITVMFLIQFAMYLMEGLRLTVDSYTLRD